MFSFDLDVELREVATQMPSCWHSAALGGGVEITCQLPGDCDFCFPLQRNGRSGGDGQGEVNASHNLRDLKSAFPSPL